MKCNQAAEAATQNEGPMYWPWAASCFYVRQDTVRQVMSGTNFETRQLPALSWCGVVVTKPPLCICHHQSIYCCPDCVNPASGQQGVVNCHYQLVMLLDMLKQY